MNTQRLLIFLATALLGGLTLSAQLGLEELKRVQRMRPVYPFDRSGDFLLMDLWRQRAEQDTTPPRPSPLWQELIIGKSLRLGQGWELGFDGLVDIFSTSNRYDGAWLGYEVFAAKNIRHGERLVLRSANNYTTKSGRYMGQHRLVYFYAPWRAGQLVLDFGLTSQNTTHLTNDEEYSEMHLNLWGTNKHYRDYRKGYVSLRNSLHLSPQLRLDALGLYEHRRPQVGYEGEAHQLLLGEVRMTYDFAPRRSPSGDYPSPYQSPRGLFAPELMLGYRLAFDPSRAWANSPSARYEVAMASLRSAYAWDDHKRLSWALVGEYITSGRGLSAYDALTLPVASALGRSPIGNSWATGQSMSLRSGGWGWGLVNYGGGRMALAHIPLLRRYQVDEELHLRALYGSKSRLWLEAGYSLGLGRMLRLGVFYGSNLDGTNEFAFRLSLPLLYLTSRASTRY